MKLKKSIQIGFMAIAILAVLIVGFFAAMFFFNAEAHPDLKIGVSFDPEYARYLGLDPARNLAVILDDWGFRYLRFNAPWNKIEPTPGNYDWSELDWQLRAAAERGARVILAIGQKTPRWPECHLPIWAKELGKDGYDAAFKNYLAAVVARYKDSPALEIWQVENEPFLPYGLCATVSRKQLAAEIDLVRNLDPRHAILTTDSGELSTWMQSAGQTDLFGTTMYRVVWNKYFGYFRYNWLAPGYYAFRALTNGLSKDSVFITELQAEPWIPGHFADISLPEQNRSMNLAQLRANLSAARATGFARLYLWGAEWWYWLLEEGEVAIPDFINNLKKE